jgi:hypothetical protein
MVILRDFSDANEGEFHQTPCVGTPLERQVRAHYTRVDGSLNYRGYFSELLGISVGSSDLDSSSGDNNGSSSSGNSSDCVMISPSTFTGKRRDESLAIVVVGSEIITMEISSAYQSEASVAEFRELYDVSGNFNEDEVILEPVGEGEYVTSVHTTEPAFFYMYTNFIKDFHLYFPFTTFQRSMLSALNIAPTQLHPNSWLSSNVLS